LASLIISKISEKDTQNLITNKITEFSTDEKAFKKSDIVVVLEISQDIEDKLTPEITTAIPSAIQTYYE